MHEIQMSSSSRGTKPILPRTYDLVVYGATGFVGKQCVAYLDQYAPPDLRWAIAGRDQNKLERLARQFERPFIVASSQQTNRLRSLAAQTRVVLSLAGPFSKYSDPLVAACVEERTHYLDISGETPWMRSLIDRYHHRVEQDQVMIIPAAGFDSIPSDLGVWLLRDLGTPLHEVDVAYTLKGGLNGGTIASALSMAEGDEHRLLGKRLLLCPEQHNLAEQPRDPRTTRWDPLRERWLVPFFMGPVNTRIVRRSAALDPQGYGPHFRYLEWMSLRGSLKAKMTLGLLGAFELGLQSRFGRRLIRSLTPRPGRGPSQAAIEGGMMRAHFTNRDENGLLSALTLRAAGDPGNLITTQCVCESALAIAAGETLGRGGVLTPMTALGRSIWDRLSRVGWELTYHHGELEGRA